MVQMGVPAVAPWDRWHLESAGMQVRSLVWHSWLRIQYCHRCSLGCCGGLDLISGLGYDMLWVGQKKKKKKMAQMNSSTEQKQTQTWRTDLWLPRGRGEEVDGLEVWG